MNNSYYDGDCYYRSLSCNINPEQTLFYDVNEGFIKGNIDKNKYNSYRNYKPTMPIVNTEKDMLLLEIQKIGFYLVDLGLYLDLHPQDKKALELFNENKKKYYRLVGEFNNKFYPLMFLDSNNLNTYSYLQGEFPFAKEG